MMFGRAVLGFVVLKLALIALGVGRGGSTLVLYPVLGLIAAALLFVLRSRTPATSAQP